MAAEQKTNAMRLVEQAGISYTAHTYPHGKDAVDGVTVAALIERDPAQVFKTLVTKELGRSIFQRSYHDHVIRWEQDYRDVWQYIENNPAKWMILHNKL